MGPEAESVEWAAQAELDGGVMHWKTGKETDFCEEWHLAFAWLPTWTEDGFTVWLGRVWRRWKRHLEIDGMYWGEGYYEYRLQEPDEPSG